MDRPFRVGDHVEHLYSGATGVVVKVGRKWLHVRVPTPGRRYQYGEPRIDKSQLTRVFTWDPDNARRIGG